MAHKGINSRLLQFRFQYILALSDNFLTHLGVVVTGDVVFAWDRVEKAVEFGVFHEPVSVVFIQPEPGTSAVGHLLSGLFPGNPVRQVVGHPEVAESHVLFCWRAHDSVDDIMTLGVSSLDTIDLVL